MSKAFEHLFASCSLTDSDDKLTLITVRHFLFQLIAFIQDSKYFGAYFLENYAGKNPGKKYHSKP